MAKDLQAEASSASTAPERLRELAERGNDLAFLVAQNPSAPPAYLAEHLEHSKDPELRRVIMQNPNLPFDELWHHAEEFPKEFFQNPSLSLYVLQDPSLLYEDEPPKALLSPKSPSWFLLMLRSHPLGKIRIQTAKILLQDPSFIEELSHDPDQNIRNLVAEHTKAPAEVLRRLRDDAQDKVRRTVVLNPSAPIDILENSSTDYPQEVARNINAPVELLEKLSSHSSDRVRSHVGLNKNTSAECIERLAQDPNHFVRRWTAQHAKLQAHSIRLLASDSEEQTRRTIALRQDVTDDDIKLLSEDISATVRAALGSNPKTPEDILEILSQDSWREVRHAVASQAKTSVNVLQKMAEQEPEDAVPFAPHSSLTIKRALMQHPNANIELLQFFLDDKDFTVRSEALALLQRRLQPKE